MSQSTLFYNGVALHELGAITIVSQSAEYTPGEYPQRETRQVAIKIDCWEKEAGYNFNSLYDNISTAREALKTQNALLVWTPPADVVQARIERPAMVVSHNLPEDPNAWGVYHQQIQIVFRFELDNSADNAALVATVTGTGTTPAIIDFGQVLSWKDDYKTAFYSEWKNIRQRSTGSISASGEIFVGLGETGATTDNRLATILTRKTELEEQLTAGRYISLTYGSGTSVFFDRDVKVEAFTADVNQGPLLGSLKWNLTISYTAFPNEDAYAGAQFTSSRTTDSEAGWDRFSLGGKIIAKTEALALSKLSSLTSIMLVAYGFASTNQTRREISKQWVNAEDTANESETNDALPVTGTAFFELSFNYGYEKKSANVVSYTMTVSDTEDLKSGLITRTFAGSIIASGSTEAAAYATALAQAQTLGDKKYPFRVSSTTSRSDRKMASQGSLEFLRLEFSYVYQVKGTRIYLEMTSSSVNEVYGESQDRLSGYVVATDLTTATQFYQTLVKSGYTSRLLRNETLDSSTETVRTGSPYTDGGVVGNSTMPMRLSFALSYFRAKTTGTYGIKYGMQVNVDYVGLKQETKINGVYYSTGAAMESLVDGAFNGSDSLSTWLTACSDTYGVLIAKEVGSQNETQGAFSKATMTGVSFNATFVKALDLGSQVVKCSLKEDTTYSGVRNIYQQVPSGQDIRQDCGIVQGSRTISGSVSGCTEAACLSWIRLQREFGLFVTWRDTEPSEYYEEPMSLNSSFEFIPLTAGSVGTRPENNGNVQMCVMDFTWRQIIPNLPATF